MSEDLKRLVEAVTIATDYNAVNPTDCIRIEALPEGVRIWIVFETDGKDYVDECLTPWRALHQARRGFNPLATALDGLIKRRTEFKP